MSETAFSIAVADAHDSPVVTDDEGTRFLVGDKEMVAYKPDEAQFAMLMASVGRGQSDSDRIAGFINFMVAIMDDKSAAYLEKRLLNRRDPFGVDHMEQIMSNLTARWTGNPTKEPSGSTASPSTGGTSSTGRILS